MDNETKYIAVLDKMYSTYHTKNADYGNAFEKSLDKYGPVAGLTRMSDKMGRIENLLLRPQDETQVPDEKISDTLMDLANYAVMMVMYYCDVTAINPGFGASVEEKSHNDEEMDYLFGKIREGFDKIQDEVRGNTIFDTCVIVEKKENIDKYADFDEVRKRMFQKFDDDLHKIRSFLEQNPDLLQKNCSSEKNCSMPETLI